MFTKLHEGMHFRQFVTGVETRRSSKAYLEVGVRDGATLSKIKCPSIGVDPKFDFSNNYQGSKTELHLYQMTSDAFFRDHDPRQILGRPLDLVFLDGLHQFEYLLRDFINSEEFCHRSGVILLDDCLPVNAEMTERRLNPESRLDKDHATWWTGDVWKIVPLLKKYRPDLKIVTVDTQPTGTVCVSHLDPSSRVLRDNYDRIVSEALMMPQEDDDLATFYASFPPLSSKEMFSGFDLSLHLG